MSDRPFSINPVVAAAGAVLCLCWSTAARGVEFRISCPLRLEVGSVQGKAPAGWRFAMPQEANLSVAGMLHGPPEESGYLVPAEIKKGKRSTWTQRWRFGLPHGYPTFVYCGYGGGSAALQLFHPIPETATECTATTKEKVGALEAATFVCR